MKRDAYDTRSLAGELARLQSMEREDLIRWWRKLYGCEPVPRMSSKLMMRALTYKVQEQVLGGLRPATRRLLVMAAKEKNADSASSINTPGMRLIREWHGNNYEVTVLEKGVLFQGKQYRSLTEVAHLITGTHWSGNKFFGLTGKKGVIRT